MRSLHKIRVGHGDGGEPLPIVFGTLAREGIRPRRGQVCMITGQPNGFKSGLALYWVVRLAQRGLTVYYISADTDPHDSKIRAAAMLSGHRMEDIEREYLQETAGAAYYDDLLSQLGTVRWDFETDPTWEYMTDGLAAFQELWGDYPDVLVVDNLMNVVADTDQEWSGMKEVTKDLHRMAWQTGSAVFVLHHQNEGDGDSLRPAPRKSVAGKVSQIPELILSLAFDNTEGLLQIACVKNRSDKSDATARTYSSLLVDAARMTIYSSPVERKMGVAV